MKKVELFGSWTKLSFWLGCGVVALLFFLAVSQRNRMNEVVEKEEVADESSKTRQLAHQDLSPRGKIRDEREEVRVENGRVAEPTAANPNSPEVSAKLEQAIALVDSKDWQGALALLEDILRDHPTHAKALAEVGMIKLIDQRDPQGAVFYFEQAVTANPNNEAVMDELVNVYADADMMAQGVTFLKRLESEHPGQLHVVRSLARTLLGLNQKDEAIEYYKRATKVAGGDAGGELFEELADVQIESGDLAGSVDSYRDAITFFENSNSGGTEGDQQRTMLGLKYVHALTTLGRREEANDYLSRMEQDDPGNEMIISIRRELSQNRQSF